MNLPCLLFVAFYSLTKIIYRKNKPLLKKIKMTKAIAAKGYAVAFQIHSSRFICFVTCSKRANHGEAVFINTKPF